MEEKQEQFEELVIRYLSGDISDDDKNHLIVLLNRNDNYKDEFKKLARIHAVSYIPLFESEKEKNLDNLLSALDINKRPNVRKWVILIGRVAAVALFILSLFITGTYIYNNKNIFGNNPDYSFETVVPVGSKIKMDLPDGTVVWLNSGTILKYDKSFGKTDRTVYLTGEGYFEVTYHSKKTFSVITPDIDIHVIGTKFNVCSYPKENTTEVNLMEGSVDIKKNNSNDEEFIHMKPDEKMVYNKVSGEITVYPCEAYQSAQWIKGKLFLVNATLADIIKDLERKYDVKIKIESDKIKNEYFSGSIDLSLPLNELLNYIDVDKKYKFTQEKNTIIIMDK